ncbi:type II toxin-antitoxin system Phd/YefM family antitoxin [Pseudonocardia sediminis]|uniref:antitoxin VbhA family protein n=1 Tax=Pseudonocardia sediminis TaxID=1397368 RepID=UPI0010299435|nr:type II toxin-antitoxin system Phd/YefM family antitoxin [Pseudonocardia sediminis]
MRLPEVLSLREFRGALASTLRQVQEPDAEPVFVGSHRKASAVVMSVEYYRGLVDAANRRADVAEALASVRPEGIEPGPAGLVRLYEIAEGRMTTAEARAAVRARHGR